MNGRSRSDRRSGHALSSSTVKAIGVRTVAEGDGVLQMLLWLRRTPESFVPGYSEAGSAGAYLPEVPPRHVLRFDTKKLHAALNAQRLERKLTWMGIAKQLGLGPSSLTHLANGGRTAFPQVMRMVQWLNRPAADFTRASVR